MKTEFSDSLYRVAGMGMSIPGGRWRVESHPFFMFFR